MAKSITDFFKRKIESCNRETSHVEEISKNADSSSDTSSNLSKKAKLMDTIDTESNKTNSKHEKFLSKWLRDFSWVFYDEEENRMFCKICQDAKMKVGIAMSGSSCFQRSTLSRHEKTNEHRLAMNSKVEAKAMKNVIESINSNITAGELAVFKTVYTMAKEELPQTKYKPIMVLMKSCGNEGIKESHMNLSHSSVTEITESISDVLELNLEEDVKQSPYISLMVDESTDIAVNHKMIIYVKYLKNNNSQCALWKNLKLSGECNADALKEILINFLHDKNVPLSKIVGFATDGAPVMMGENNGLGKKLQDLMPAMLHYHCIAHRLALAVSQAANDIGLFKSFQKTLSSLYAYFHMSNIRMEKLKLMQDILNEPNITLKDINAVRWLSLGNAVDACHVSYDAAVLALTEIVERKSISSAIDKGPGLLKHCTEYSFVAILALLRDVLLIVNKVSKIFQSDDIDFSTVINELHGTIDRLELMKEEMGYGTHLREFLNVTKDGAHYRDIKLTVRGNAKRDFVSAKDKFLCELVDNLKERFNLETMFLLKDLDHLLNPSCILSTASSRHESITRIIEHYYAISTTYFSVTAEELKEELFQIQSLYTRYHDLKFNQFCRLILSYTLDGAQMYPGFSKLCQLAMVIPLSTAVCERGFSTQNRIKTQKRSKLNEKHLEVLTRISEQGPKFAEQHGNVECMFKFEDAIKLWKTQKQRRLNL